jgi:hypothetical protein
VRSPSGPIVALDPNVRAVHNRSPHLDRHSTAEIMGGLSGVSIADSPRAPSRHRASIERLDL